MAEVANQDYRDAQGNGARLTAEFGLTVWIVATRLLAGMIP
jgi:hypothetical protein